LFLPKNPYEQTNEIMDKKIGPLRATLRGILDLFGRTANIGELGPEDRIDGLNCLITGANKGLGKAIAIELARRGGNVHMVGRTMDKEAKAEIAQKSENPSIEMHHCDLAELDTIHRLTRELKESRVTFQIVVLNAGIVHLKPKPTKRGLDEMFVVNYLANFLLVDNLLEQGIIAPQAAGTYSPIPRIVLVSSEAHRWITDVDFETLGTYEPGTIKQIMSLYARDKFCLTTWGMELSRRLSSNGQIEVAVHAHCPGAIRSQIAREAPPWIKPLLWVLFRFFQSPRKACRPALYLSCAKAIEGQTGIYLHLMKQKQVDARAKDPVVAKKLWEVSERLLQPYFARCASYEGLCPRKSHVSGKRHK
jgi:NAD(P)-dependent dehydrogenase (short-subunit alcohol dehydrogenase family)